MQDHLFHRKIFFKKKFPFPVATLGNCLTESSKRSLTFMEQMFPCGMMSHASRRMWEREEGMRKERELRVEEELWGRARRRKPRRDICASGPTGWTKEWERLETWWMKLKSTVRHLITSLWRFLQGKKNKKSSTWKIWQLFNTSRQHSNIYADFPELSGHNSGPIIRILILIPSLIWSVFDLSSDGFRCQIPTCVSKHPPAFQWNKGKIMKIFLCESKTAYFMLAHTLEVTEVWRSVLSHIKNGRQFVLGADVFRSKTSEMFPEQSRDPGSSHPEAVLFQRWNPEGADRELKRLCCTHWSFYGPNMFPSLVFWSKTVSHSDFVEWKKKQKNIGHKISCITK